MKFPCRCCGLVTLVFRDEYRRCPVCFWIDDYIQARYPDEKNCANSQSLNEARANFIETWAADGHRTTSMRMPTLSELPKNNPWHPKMYNESPLGGIYGTSTKFTVPGHDWSEVKALLRELFANPLLHVTREDYYAVVNFLCGLDRCCRELDLEIGFTEWLKPKVDPRNWRAWPYMAPRIIPNFDVTSTERVFPDWERQLIRGLEDLLFQYLDERDSQIQDE